MHGVKIQGGDRRHCPNVLFQVVCQQGEEGTISGIASTGHIDDEPEEGLVCLIAVVWVLFA